jgi:DNA (cytosine-5)-methyltransferase 1
LNNALQIQIPTRTAKLRASFDAQLLHQRESFSEEGEKKTAVELFAGIGLVHEAIYPLGWKVVLANDNDPKKSNAYQANYPDVPFNLEDVRRLDLRELPAVQLITASFPCVDLSQAGNREGLNGEHSSLVRTFLDKVGELVSVRKKPEFLLVENVPNLLSIHEGAALDEILHTLAGLKYGFDLVQVDAKHFTPQSRNRVFIIAVDLARHELNQRAFPSDNLHRHKVRDAYLRHPKLPWFFFDFPPMPARQLSLRDILEDVPAKDSSWWDEKQMEYFWTLLEHDHKIRLKSVLATGTNHVFTAVRRLRRRRKREQIFNIRFDGLASCLRTPRGGSSTQYVILTANGKIQGRRLTGLEAARLQGVCLPDYSPDYKLVGSETDVRFAFGDAVCVPALKWVVEHSIEELIPTLGVRNGKATSLQKNLVFD